MSIAVRLLGALLVLIGLVLGIGGAWLTVLGGSPYYVVAGVGLLASGLLLARLRFAGAVAYLAVFAVTLIWAVWEAGLDGWSLVPRLVAPLVILLLVILSLPALTRHGGKSMLASLAAFVLLVGAGGGVVAMANRAAPAKPLPPPIAGPGRAMGSDWIAYGGSHDAQRFSAAAQITPANVGELERAWTFRTGDIPDKFGAETTPLKIGDSVYLCSAMNKLFALDARDGKQRWTYDPKVSKDAIPYTAACRGVTYFAQPDAPPGAACATRIIEGTLDGRLIAVDARTGKPCPGFGRNGQVDIKLGMGQVVPGMVSITSAPTIVRGIIVTGHQVLDGQKRWAPSGVIQGYDAVTGQMRFAWDMMAPDISAQPPPGRTYTPGTPNMWTTATGDEALGLVYLPMGNSAADYYSSLRRPAEKEWSSALVALDVTTGKPRWKFQTAHNDVWDYDLGSQGTLVDFPTAGGTVPAIILPSKQGEIYVLDRATGRPLTRVEERPVPGGGVEPAERAKTQPFSLYHTLAKAPLTEKDMWGMSPIDQMICRIQFKRAVYKGPYTPPEAKARWIQYPGYNGGSDWGGVALDPRRGVIVANYNDMPNYNQLIPRAVADAKGWFPRGDPRAKPSKPGGEGAADPQTGVPYAIAVNAGWRMPGTGMLCKKPPYGGIRAIDLKTGATLWDRPFGTARRNGPFGIPSMLPIDIGTPNNGGSVVTAGGLVFIAAATDNLFRAIDIETGKTVWSDVLPAGGQANPMVYEQDGRQYVVIMAGGHHFMETPAGDHVIAYALPRR
ncbi:membrane-bound PQQ-dependent dehydrogenase, glucose/quinate/shikimate family [Caulobacter endophyticus]|uniref:Membrane-bound PQQ-dependent dehydrogenase, glucose/quinate/shikimate family n=1 Tax=Caulobacter endophyticus TaxID=2172652 RepID=A0A2T9JGX7_9CAUL|nr:membrane-bound PQQ-dependent dehydrogenase, glucose/quinate/shikimate family [Caulobacter endophyticus]PVM82937.1 membrane-bound PQQ-dependent dehydrogenase, glucose/quinate/shikimate family [Caulobacter endophyticus]